MTKGELEQYRSIVAEIDELRDKIHNNTVSDTVTGSLAVFPYTAHTIQVYGADESGTSQKDMALLRRLEGQRKAVEDFVDAIDDSTTRRIFQYRYMRGVKKPTWVQIARKMYPGLKNEYLKNMSETLRKRYSNYLKKI